MEIVIKIQARCHGRPGDHPMGAIIPDFYGEKQKKKPGN